MICKQSRQPSPPRSALTGCFGDWIRPTWLSAWGRSASPWRQATVSEIEREGGGRNVTITEMLGLALALDVTIEQLVDSRGPDGWRGPYMILSPTRPASRAFRQLA